ncbi:universal stress protein [Haloplanus rubicundus]|uniref:Universal stress protein n=1 Tax=Haloplanus rubicundus TaxID=1547898 RepID=A0A345EGK9_9EURY|nr:universal stress protein [Haloplanus rubicundus]AXG11331.1 universal stress protein [Haloplanus rubicundus]
MYRVLVPVDSNTNRARHQAQYVARLPDADSAVAATVLYVSPPDRFESAKEASFSKVDSAATAAEELERAGVEVDRRIDGGSVSRAIVDAIADVDADEVVMGGRKRSGVTTVLLGSTVQDVLLSTERPVTVTGERVSLGEGTRKVLVPVDGSEERARQQARYVAGLPGDPSTIEATVFYVFRHQDYAGAPPHEFEDVDSAVTAAEMLEDAGVTVNRVAEGGEVARRILRAAEDHAVDGIVVGGRKRSGVQNVLLGSTVQDVLLSAERPVTVTG